MSAPFESHIHPFGQSHLNKMEQLWSGHAEKQSRRTLIPACARCEVSMISFIHDSVCVRRGEQRPIPPQTDHRQPSLTYKAIRDARASLAAGQRVSLREFFRLSLTGPCRPVRPPLVCPRTNTKEQRELCSTLLSQKEFRQNAATISHSAEKSLESQ